MLFIALFLLFSCDSSTPGSDITPPLDPDMPEGNITIVSGDGLYAPTDTVQLSYEQQREVLWATDNSDLVAVDATGLVSVKQRTEAIEIQSVSIYAHSNGALLGRKTLNIGDYRYDTESSTYHIYSELGLNEWANSENCLSANVKLEQDITMTKPENKDDSNWTGIGNYNNRYNATFDGQNHTISGLTLIRNINFQRLGFFQCISSNAVIKNLILKDVYIYNLLDHVGAIVGESYGKIENCTASGIITILEGIVGGIVGVINGGKISGCTNYCSVSSSRYNVTTGGIVGYASRATILNCKNHGEIDSNSGHENIRAGGIAGRIYSTPITDCFNYGKITASNSKYSNPAITNIYLGGIVGYAEVNSSSITNCTVEECTLEAYYYPDSIQNKPYIDYFVGGGDATQDNNTYKNVTKKDPIILSST